MESGEWIGGTRRQKRSQELVCLKRHFPLPSGC